MVTIGTFESEAKAQIEASRYRRMGIEVHIVNMGGATGIPGASAAFELQAAPGELEKMLEEPGELPTYDAPHAGTGRGTSSRSGDPDLRYLESFIGHERALNEVTQGLHFFANQLRPKTVGAIHVTCADESELECADTFRKGFAHYLLPPLKFAQRSPMRLANLGGQYEWGAIRIADEHFPTDQGFKLVVVKINSHVGVVSPREQVSRGEANAGGAHFGAIRRYGRESPCCGALSALLSGSTQSFTRGLRELFGSEGLDRESLLRDDSKVDPSHRPLVVALLSARLQARKAVLDIGDYRSPVPTYWLVMASATLNKEGRDSEVVAGIYVVDARDGRPATTYRGLGDDPSAYRVNSQLHGLSVEDDNIGQVRSGRDHRALAREEWRRRKSSPVADQRFEEIRQEVLSKGLRERRNAKTMLRLAIPLLAEVAAIPVAMLLFAEGAAGIHHAFRIHKLAENLEGKEDAQEILRDVHSRVEQLDPHQAEALIELLVKEYSAP